MNTKSEILMISPDFTSTGGISSVVKLYADYGLCDGEVIYLGSYKKGNIFFQIIFFPIFLVKYILILLLNRDIKLVHIHTASRGSFLRKSFAFFIAKFFKKKIILHIHGAEFDLFYGESCGFIQKIITCTLNKSDVVIVLSEEWKNKISNICSNENIKILYNACAIKESHKEAHPHVQILFMGRLSERKGVYDIINAAKHIQNVSVVIDLYGDGETDELQRIISENGLQDKIKINGWVSGDEKDAIFRSSDVLILPSYREGLPVSILEALSYGLPVISTPVGGIPEAVEDGVNGFIVQCGDYHSLTQKIDILADNPQIRAAMGEASYKIAQEKFDTKVIFEQLEKIYNDMLK